MNELIASLVFSSIGLYYMAHGKRTDNVTYMLTGLVLLLYTYFVSGLGLIIVVGVGLCLLPFLLEYFL